MVSDTPTRPDPEMTTESAASPEWQVFMRSVRRGAEDAWATGRRYYEASFLTMDRTGPHGHPEDAAGAIEAIESVGWKLEHVGYVNLTGGGQSTGIFDSAAVRIRGFYLFRRPGS